jgi:hypothetical protein
MNSRPYVLRLRADHRAALARKSSAVCMADKLQHDHGRPREYNLCPFGDVDVRGRGRCAKNIVTYFCTECFFYYIYIFIFFLKKKNKERI